MIIEHLQEFFQCFDRQKPLLAIDYGTKKIGTAISDLEHNFAIPLQFIKSSILKDQLDIIISIVQKHKACGIVIGLPINMDGTKSNQTTIVERFSSILAQNIAIPIFMQDERLTSKAANNLLKELNLKRKKRNSIDDSISASMILDTTLERCKQLL